MKAKRIIGAVFVFIIACSLSCINVRETPSDRQGPKTTAHPPASKRQGPKKIAPHVKIQPPVHLKVRPGSGPKSAEGIPYVVTVMPRRDVDEAVLLWNLPYGARMTRGRIREQIPAGGLRRNSRTTYNVVLVPGTDNQNATVSVKVRIGDRWYGAVEEVDLSVPGGKAEKPGGKAKGKEKPRTEFHMKRVD